MFTNYNFTKDFEINVVDSFGWVTAIRPTEQIKEEVLHVMEDPDNDETTSLCLRTVLSALEHIHPGKDGTPDFLDAKTIIKYFLSLPVETFQNVFDKLTRKYEALDAKEEVPKGYVSRYYPTFSTLNEFYGFFLYLERHLREELKKTVGDAFGVRVPEADINPEDVQIIFKSEDLPEPFNKEDLQNIETEDPELEFTPIY